jgi:hypothetical protein
LFSLSVWTAPAAGVITEVDGGVGADSVVDMQFPPGRIGVAEN